MPIAAKLDEWGRPAWVALMILGFLVWWPIGLATLAFMIGSGRMACCSHYGQERWQRKMARWQEKMDRATRFAGAPWGYQPSSGNAAFDEYRTQTLRRLEEEQREFREFVERLRAAKDRAEFDQFMASRRGNNGGQPSANPQG